MRHPGGDNPMPDAVALDQANNGPILRHMPQIVPSGATAHHAQIVRPECDFYGARVGSVDGRRREVRHRGRHRATPERSQQNANSSGTAIPLLLLAPIWQLDHFLMSRQSTMNGKDITKKAILMAVMIAQPITIKMTAHQKLSLAS